MEYKGKIGSLSMKPIQKDHAHTHQTNARKTNKEFFLFVLFKAHIAEHTQRPTQSMAFELSNVSNLDIFSVYYTHITITPKIQISR